jgi:hypothetical protein
MVESGNLDLPFFIEFNLTRDSPIRYFACIRNISSQISIIFELMLLASSLKFEIRHLGANFRAYHQNCRMLEALSIYR